MPGTDGCPQPSVALRDTERPARQTDENLHVFGGPGFIRPASISPSFEYRFPRR